MGKKALYLKYSEWAPTIMDLVGIKRGHGDQVALAEALGIKPQSITKFIQRDQLPTDRILLLWINNHFPMEKFESMISGKKSEKRLGVASDELGNGGAKKIVDGDRAHREVVPKSVSCGQSPNETKLTTAVQVQRRREEDIYYSHVPALRESGPEWCDGRQILKLFLLKDVLGPTCSLNNLQFIIQEESNFHPTIPTGTILVVDRSNHKITSAIYLFSYGAGSYALRRIDPVDAHTVRVTSGLSQCADSRDMSIEQVQPLIVGRVVWAVYKI